MRSPFAPVFLSIAALIAALVRWLMQGSWNLYPSLGKRFYIPDPDLGWRISPDRPIWLGLLVCAGIAAIAVGLAGGGRIIRRREATHGQRATMLRATAWVVAGATLAAPIIAFATGARPASGVDSLPASTIQGIEAGITGIVDAPAGRYEVVQHAGTSIVAHLSAGGEEFDARFEGGIRGAWQGDPHDLTRPVTAEVSVEAASVDTGISLRSRHAREEYLLTDKHPRISVTLDRLIGATQAGANTVAFRAHGTLGLVGKTHPIEVTGTLKKPDAAALARLGLSGEIVLVQADFAIAIKETALAGDAGTIGDRIPIQVSLVMRHTSG